MSLEKEISTINETSALEYPTFRVPYEELNCKFRQGQKRMEMAGMAIKRFATALERRIGDAQDAIPVEKVKGAYKNLCSQVEELENALSETVGNEIELAERLQARIAYMDEQQDPSDDCPTSLIEWKNDRNRVARYSIWYLLRCGHFGTAKRMAESYKMKDIVDLDVFENCKKIEDSLRGGDTRLCLEWIELHRPKLKKMKSKLEMFVRQQDVVDLVSQKKILDALKYVRANITPQMRPDCQEELQTIMGIIGLSDYNNRFAELFSPVRWEKVGRMFVEELFLLYQLPFQSAFSLCLQCGLAAHKTPLCRRDDRSKKEIQCYVCDKDAWPIAEGLPNGHVSQSRILCSISGQLCDEKNVPFMLPSGRICGENVLAPLRVEDDLICDPETNQWVPAQQIQRLYFM
ncbi:unnamed protein product [Caenorhabditis auriculariae]|uniref:CTLH domain-containing protein n=1 Tax=Caenorhabditis auriculariae TaxID=2777116 RepID=A0A8S1GPT4_9PELO|nr:unnamed protein product [Caenorhabditis auriculariae]